MVICLPRFIRQASVGPHLGENCWRDCNIRSVNSRPSWSCPFFVVCTHPCLYMIPINWSCGIRNTASFSFIGYEHPHFFQLVRQKTEDRCSSVSEPCCSTRCVPFWDTGPENRATSRPVPICMFYLMMWKTFYHIRPCWYGFIERTQCAAIFVFFVYSERRRQASLGSNNDV